MSIERTPKEKRFSRIDRNVFEDPNLSFEAKGLLGYLLSQTDNWVLIRKKVIGDYGIGKDRLGRIVKELQSTGYLYLEQPKAKGRFTKNECVIYESPLLNPHFIDTSDTPQADPPQAEAPETEVSETESPETDSRKTESLETESSPTDDPLLTTTDGINDLEDSNDVEESKDLEGLNDLNNNTKFKKNNNSSEEIDPNAVTGIEGVKDLPSCITGHIRNTIKSDIKSLKVSDANDIIDQLNRGLNSEFPTINNPTGWIRSAIKGCNNGTFQPTASPKEVSDDKRRKRNEMLRAGGSRISEQKLQELIKNNKTVKPGSSKGLMN